MEQSLVVGGTLLVTTGDGADHVGRLPAAPFPRPIRDGRSAVSTTPRWSFDHLPPTRSMEPSSNEPARGRPRHDIDGTLARLAFRGRVADSPPRRRRAQTSYSTRGRGADACDDRLHPWSCASATGTDADVKLRSRRERMYERDLSGVPNRAPGDGQTGADGMTGFVLRPARGPRLTWAGPPRSRAAIERPTDWVAYMELGPRPVRGAPKPDIRMTSTLERAAWWSAPTPLRLR